MVKLKLVNSLFSANGKAALSNKPVGKVKILVNPQYNEILGFSIVGQHATELIGQGTIMLHAEITADMLEDLVAAHQPCRNPYMKLF